MSTYESKLPGIFNYHISPTLCDCTLKRGYHLILLVELYIDYIYFIGLPILMMIYDVKHSRTKMSSKTFYRTDYPNYLNDINYELIYLNLNYNIFHIIII